MKSKLQQFEEEFSALQDKYGIYVDVDYEEQVDYDWNENPYTSGVNCYIIYLDKDRNLIKEDDYDI